MRQVLQSCHPRYRTCEVFLFNPPPSFRLRREEGERGQHEDESVRPYPRQTDPRSVLQPAERQPAAVGRPGQHHQADQVP